MRGALPLLFVVCACHSATDQSLLTEHKEVAINVGRLTDSAELLRALSLSGQPLDEKLGPHHMAAKQTITLRLPDGGTSRLDESFSVRSDGRGTVELVHDNERYGFAAFAQKGELWVKPRYGTFVKHRIEGDELIRLRRTAETAAASDLRLLRRFLQVRSAGPAEVAGRAGLKLSFARRATPLPAVEEEEPGRKWRQEIDVNRLDGYVIVDAKTGAPLVARLLATYTFNRGGQRLAASLDYRQTTRADPGALVAPGEAAELGRARPMLDRHSLLDGLE